MDSRTLDTDVQFLKGIGPRFAPGLHKLGLHTVRDVFYHMPRRYEDRRNLPEIKDIRAGQFVTIRGRVARVESRPTNRGMVILKAYIRDGTGTVVLTWFNQPWIARMLDKCPDEIVAYGLVKENGVQLEISSPEWEIVAEDDDPEDFARIVPVYPLTEGLQQKTVRRAVRSSLEHYADLLVDPLPESLRRDQRLRPLRWCVRQMHAPESEEFRLQARQRMVFEEFFYLQVAMAMRRAATQQELGIAFPISRLKDGTFELPDDLKAKAKRRAAMVVTEGGVDPEPHLFVAESRAKRDGEPLWDQIHRMLPFELTGAQRRVIEEIYSDMEQPHPMNRLLQGDVGSGKTAVAACAMLAAVRSGFQVALMAPTEILAEQHEVTLRRLFEPLGIEVDLLVGKLTPTQKKKAAERTASGLANIAIGTHALIQEGVSFSHLGLVIIDEQHRFGVMQRKALRDKGLGNPDVLVMTATPIPRTLTMTWYGDLELSVIDELPPGRKPIKTHWKRSVSRDAVYENVESLLAEGRQAYFVCPMVSESEKMLAQAAEDLHYRLKEGIFRDREIGLLHGQMRPKEKEEVMQKFRDHELDVLVSTTVIEVGVDVPNASVMVIEDANRFGLSQLHQLRGRVGRGEFQSYCIMVADVKSEDARRRLEVMVETTDGFAIADEDLKLRGPGQMAGTQQSGNADFKIADLVMDGKMLEVARQAAIQAVEKDPRLEEPEWADVLGRVRERRSELAVITVS